MVVFGSKSSSTKTKLFEQPLDKLFNPKAIKHFNETIAASNSRSPPALCQSLSAPLTSSTLTWAKLSQENSATKRKRAAARLRRFTIDANNNTSGLITSLASAPIISPAAAPLCISHRLEASPQCTTTSPSNLSTTSNSNTNDSNHHETTTSSEGQLNEDERCRLLLNVLPEPIRCLLNEIYLRGPSTVGIFRKSPNAKHCKELKQKLESPDFHLSAIEQFQVNVIASVFKEWLRSLPDCLLMSRLYPQWIDVAKLIEPLHLHYQKQQQQQLQQQQQSNDHALDTRLGSTSAFEGNLNGNLTKSSNGSGDCKPPTSLRPTQPATSPLTDNGQKQQKQLQQQAGNLTTATTDAVVHGQQQLSRALSCSIMASDSGHSSTSSSPSSSSSSFDSCEVVAGARAGKHFQKATSEIHQQSSAQVAASYLKRKCYQQRQQSQSSIDYDSTRNIGSLISVDGCMSDMANSQSGNFHSNNNNMSMSMSEFSIRERRFECIRVVRQLLEALNETNLILLRAIICVLWNIADNHNYNKMSSNNLGVCIGQSLLNDEQQQHYLQSRGKKLQSFTLSLSSSSQLAHHQTNDAPKHASTSNNFTKRHRRARSQCLLASTLSLTNLSHLSTNSSPTNSTASNGQLTNSISSNYLDSSGAQEAAKYVPILVAFMIDNAKELFGSDVMYLFGPDRPLKQSDQENNETTLSDSQSQQPVTTTTTTGSSQASLVEAEICANIGEQVAVVVGANITTPTTKVRTKDQLVHIGGCGGSNGDELAHDDHHSLECKSIVVTREQNEPLGRRSDLFVKMDAQQPSEHLISSKQLTTAPSSCISQVKQHRRHMSTSVLVHIGSQPFTTSDHVTGAPSESSDAKGRVQLHANNDNATKLATSPETTSILIVNTPKKQQTDQLLLSPESAFELDHNHRCASSSYDDDAKEYSSSSRSSSISNDLQLKLRQQQTSDSQSSGSADSVDHHHRRCPDSSSPSSLIGVDDRVNDTTSDQEHKATTTGAAVTTTTMTDTTTIADSTTQQQRPLSVTESTTSSSRASSSTSGVHSESPAFSCEQDSASSSSSSTTSSSHHNCGTRSATTCSTSSRSASISSPTSSALSSCTSPTDMDMGTDVIDGDHHHHQHNHNHERHMGIDVTTLSHNEAMRHNLIGQVRLDPAPKLPSQVTSAGISLREPRVSMSGGLVESRTSLERPRSMVSLGKQADIMSRDNNMDQAGATIVRYQNINNNNNGNSISHDRQYSSALNANNDKENQFIMNQRQHRSQFQSQTLNRYSSASSQLVNLNRMPKIPFQYTTSCYGGEAVLYYPTNAHLSHHQSMRHQQDQQQQQQQAMLRQQQQGGPFPSATMQLRGCNRFQSLDRHTQLHHSSGQLHQQQQQQQPQRSHVMMLRDYYLSLQEQSQKQQQYQEFLKRQHQQSKQQMLVSCQNQKTAVTNSTTIGDHLQAIQQQHPQQQYHRQSHLMMMQPPVESRRILSSHQAQQQQQQLQHHHHQQQQQKQQCSSVTTNLNAMQADGATNASRNNDHELMREQQPASATAAAAAVAYQCIQPRLARIPPNQFNGLYVKRATSPMRSHEINGNDLMVLDHRHQAASGCGGGGGSIVVKPIASSGAAGSNLMAISQSSLSQQSSKMSSSSSTAEHSSDEEVCSSDECSTSEWMESTMV